MSDKMLMENWRKYLVEEYSVDRGEWVETADDMSLGGIEKLIKLIHKGREKEDSSIVKKAVERLKEMTGEELAMALIEESISVGLKPIKLIGDFFKAKQARAGKGKTHWFKDSDKQFPILDLLDMDQNYIDYLDNDILRRIDEEYEAYLDDLPDSTRIPDIKDINVFVVEWVAHDSMNGFVIISKAPDPEGYATLALPSRQTVHLGQDVQDVGDE